LAESAEAYTRFYNEAFVVMQYFGYLRRNPDKFYLDSDYESGPGELPQHGQWFYELYRV
jgi:hypothetical protein